MSLLFPRNYLERIVYETDKDIEKLRSEIEEISTDIHKRQDKEANTQGTILVR